MLKLLQQAIDFAAYLDLTLVYSYEIRRTEMV